MSGLGGRGQKSLGFGGVGARKAPKRRLAGGSGSGMMVTLPRGRARVVRMAAGAPRRATGVACCSPECCEGHDGQGG